MARSLVIVESPAKAGTLGKFLGKDFRVAACYDHVRDLDRKGIAVDRAKGYEPQYRIVPGKERTVAELRRAAVGAETIYLAADPDRVGEAICWHPQEILKPGLPKATFHRAEFHEITKSAVTRAVQNPGTIDQNRVNAQQTRRILDRLVGYKISPLLWERVRSRTSAGRVQSVACQTVDLPAEPYTSADRGVIDRQVAQAEGAGIDAFVQAWYGPQEANNQTETNFRTLLDVAGGRGFKAATSFETTSHFLSGDSGAVTNALATLLTTHLQHPGYLRYQGKPVIFFWRQQQFSVETWQAIRDQVDPNRSVIWIAEGTDIAYQAVFDGHHLYSIAWADSPAVQLAKWGDTVRAYEAENGVDRLWVATAMLARPSAAVTPLPQSCSRSRRGPPPARLRCSLPRGGRPVARIAPPCPDAVSLRGQSMPVASTGFRASSTEYCRPPCLPTRVLVRFGEDSAFERA